MCLHNVQKIKRAATFDSCSQFLFSFWNIHLEVFCNSENQYRSKATNNQFSIQLKHAKWNMVDPGGREV
jgi:hypothetical protein